MTSNPRFEQLQLLLSQSPEDPFLRFAIAKEWESQGQTDLALDAWSWFSAHAPEYTGFYYHYAHLLHQAGQNQKALIILRKGLEVTQSLGERHDLSELKHLLASFEEEE